MTQEGMTQSDQQPGVNTQNLRDLSTLRRSVADRKVAGVAGGLGRHLNVDPTVLRVLFVVLCFFGGAGFLLYGAAWLLVPEEGKDEAVVSTSTASRNALLVVVAALAAILLVGDSWGSIWFPWPLALLALVAFLVLMNRDRSMSSPIQPPGPGAQPHDDHAPSGGVATGEANAYAPGEPQSPAPPWTPTTQQGYQPPAPRPDRGPVLFWPTLALLAVALGSLGLYDVAGGDVVDAAYPALALAVVGLVLVVGAWVGRAGGLILLGLVTALVLAVTSAVEPRFGGDRQVDATPTLASQVDERYSVPAGSIRLDMSDIRDVEALDGRDVTVEANAGEIVVTVPENVDVNVRAEVSFAGEARVEGERRSGTDVLIERVIDGGDDDVVPELYLNLELLVGSIEVRTP